MPQTRFVLKKALALQSGGPFLPQLYIDGRYLCGGQGLVERVVAGSMHGLLEKRGVPYDVSKRVVDDGSGHGMVAYGGGGESTACQVAGWLQLQQLRSENTVHLVHQEDRRKGGREGGREGGGQGITKRPRASRADELMK